MWQGTNFLHKTAHFLIISLLNVRTTCAYYASRKEQELYFPAYYGVINKLCPSFVPPHPAQDCTQFASSFSHFIGDELEETVQMGYSRAQLLQSAKRPNGSKCLRHSRPSFAAWMVWDFYFQFTSACSNFEYLVGAHWQGKAGISEGIARR